MEPISFIVTALATGAAAALKPTAEQIVKDAYAAIKGLITRKYQNIDVTPLENKPESETKRASLAEDLTDVGAANDKELVEQAKTLIDAIEKYDRSAAAAIGVDLEEVKAAYLKVQKVVAEGTGVKIRKGEFSQGIEIGEVQAGNVGDSSNPKG